MGVLGVFFGCRGDGGFNGRCLGASIGDGGFALVCISGCRGVIGFNVATSQLPVREKVRPARSDGGASAKKFALRTKNGPQSAFYGVPGELFRGLVGERVCRANFVAYTGTVARYHRGCGALHAGNGGGFALHEALWPRVARVSEPHVVQFPRVVAGVVCVLAEVLAAGPFDWQC